MVKEIKPFRTTQHHIGNDEQRDLNGAREVKPMTVSRRINTREVPEVEVVNGSDDPKEQIPDSSAIDSVRDSGIDSTGNGEQQTQTETRTSDPSQTGHSASPDASAAAARDQTELQDLPF